MAFVISVHRVGDKVTGVILGGVFEKVENPMLLYGAGTSALIILLIMGYYFLKQALKK
jgi:hypothetical protein